jgi:hypothetical protein
MNGRKGIKNAGKKEQLTLQFQRDFPPVVLNNFKVYGDKSL